MRRARKRPQTASDASLAGTALWRLSTLLRACATPVTTAPKSLLLRQRRYALRAATARLGPPLSPSVHQVNIRMKRERVVASLAKLDTTVKREVSRKVIVQLVPIAQQVALGQLSAQLEQ